MKPLRILTALWVLLGWSAAQAQRAPSELSYVPDAQGRIDSWLVSGPYEQPFVGFGVPADFSPFAEAGFAPVWNRDFGLEQAWFVQTADQRGFLDFNEVLAWASPGPGPEMIWEARASFAFVHIVSDTGGEATLHLGGNSRLKAVLNGQTVLQSEVDENAVPDAYTVNVTLKPGKNDLLLRTTQSHKNIGIVVFDELSYDWGFYARIEAPGQTLRISLPVQGVQPKVKAQSTFFFKEMDGVMHQRHDLFLQNPADARQFTLTATAAGNVRSLTDGPMKAGVHRLQLWLPEVSRRTNVEVAGTRDGRPFRARVEVHPQPKYTLHLMSISHLDIGYTHTQPIVKELQMRTLDEVIDMCESDPDFRWTIETLWILEAYREGRSEARFALLIDLIHQGRIAVSPFYSNPFTGMVDAEEMIRSLDAAARLRAEFGLEFPAAIYNDVPGQSWIVPQILRDQGIGFLANGFNEVYGDYALQRALPKVFQWEGADGSRVIYYRNEAYNEGMAYGLERDNAAVAHRMWMRISRLQNEGYPSRHILLNAAFGDNVGIAARQWQAHKTWNQEYAWPRFQPATLADFASILTEEVGDRLPVLRGDATSDWDILFQGEPERMQRYRQNQHRRKEAETMAVAGALLNPGFSMLKERLDRAVDRQLEYSGHGSGLEYGYGTDHENAVTLDFRESYVAEASQNLEEVLERGTDRWLRLQASLEGQFVVVFNPHSHSVTWPVSVDFNPIWEVPYDVEDMGQRQPSFWENSRLSFMARDIPALGWKKFRLVPRGASQPSSDLAATATSLENERIRLEIDGATGEIISLVDKTSGLDLTSPKHPLFQFQMSEGGLEYPFLKVDLPSVELSVVDQRPVSMSLVVKRAGGLLPSIHYTLHAGSPIVHASADVDLKALQPTEQPQAYGIAFPIGLGGALVQVETLGGFIDGTRDRLPGTDPTAYSMREALAVSDGQYTVHLASPDNRVTFMRRTEEGLPVVVSNVVNHFPEHWNRREENEAVLRIRYALTVREGGFDPGFSHRFGQNVAMPPKATQYWYNAEPASESALTLSAEHSTLLALRALGPERSDGVLLRLRNMHPLAPDALILDAPWLSEGQLCVTDLTGQTCKPQVLEGGNLRLTLQPNEIRTLRWVPGPPLQTRP